MTTSKDIGYQSTNPADVTRMNTPIGNGNYQFPIPGNAPTNPTTPSSSPS